VPARGFKSLLLHSPSSRCLADFTGRTGEREYQAELHRLEGELLLESKGVKLTGRQRRPAIAEDCFLKAIAVAREQGAKLFELRSMVSLARSRHERLCIAAPTTVREASRGSID
jgi:hypothetical protein